jgi:hypothetical protein
VAQPASTGEARAEAIAAEQERELARKNLRLMLLLVGLVIIVTLGGLAFFVLLYVFNAQVPADWWSF